ncbi:uncharacterized protein LOC119266770 [Triticum dicoccoides]|uniref:uncharacterized protein LOC119266770 n=1 Tax=Triticum dicoccoides TaxID=85692 RepID=UPI0018905FA0|nr:uncharacterized protein LOC119266770 [Triticum dicoccoides]
MPPRVGDPSLRPEEGHVVITSTQAMEDAAASLASLGAFVWLGGNRPRVSAAEIRDAIASEFFIDRNYIKVVPHFPEDFFALFTHPHHRDQVTASPGRFNRNGLDIHAANWRPEANADSVEAYYHVHLCIENLPLNAWCDEVAEQVLRPNTFLHYFDVATVKREDSSSFNLWAWSANPSAIPKVLRLTITGKQAAGYSRGPSAVIGRRGLKRRVLVHLETVEDFTPDASGVIPHRPRSSHPFSWRYGVIDGESRMRDRLEVAGRRREDDQDRDRRDDDDDRGRRGREDRSSSWRDRLFRSRSRAPVHREDEGRHGSRDGHRDDRGGRREDRGGRRDGRDDRDGRRRCSEAADARRIDWKQVQRLPDGAVIPASGRRARLLTNNQGTRSARSGGAASPICEDNRGRSPPPKSTPTSCEVVQVSSSPGDASWLSRFAPCFGAQARPAVVCPVALYQDTSPRTTMQDIIELHPSTPPAHPCSAATPPLMLIASTPHVSPADLSPLFVTCAPPLLPAPNSTPPRLPRARRKTLAGVSGFNLSRRSPRLQAKKRTLPVAQMAERLLCQRMGIINEGQEVTEEAIREFVAMFNGQLPDTTVAALRALFNLDCDLAKAVEDALVEHGGEARAELESANGEVAGEAA